MVRRKGNGVRRRQKKKTSPTRRRTFRKRSTTQTGLGGLIAKGIRTILMTLPGSTLTVPIADVAFKALGYATGIELGDGNTVKADTKVTGLCSLFHVDLKDILFESYTHGARTDASTWATNYNAGCLRSLQIRVRPEAPNSQRRGVWAMAFIPFRNAEDERVYVAAKAGMFYEQIRMLPGAVAGSTMRDLSLTYVPTVRDGRLYTSLGLDDSVGAVIIAFDQTNRTVYGNFGLDDFSCIATLSGVVALQRPQEAPHATTYDRKITDQLNLVSAIVSLPDRSLCIPIEGPAALDQGDSILVKGVVSPRHFDRLSAYLLGTSVAGMETGANQC